MNNPLGRYSDFSGDGGIDTNEKQGEKKLRPSKVSRSSGGGDFGQPSLMSIGGGGGGMSGMGMGMGGNMGMIIRQEIQSIKAVVGDLQDDRDKLRNGIRKLKV